MKNFLKNTIKIYSFLDKNISLKRIFKDYIIENNRQKEDVRI